MNQIFHNPAINDSASYKSLHDLVGNFTQPVSPNTTLIFGDFMSAFNLLKNLMTGGVFNAAFGGCNANEVNCTPGVMSGSGFYDSSVQLLMGLLFDGSCIFFILYIISNRSI